MFLTGATIPAISVPITDFHVNALVDEKWEKLVPVRKMPGVTNVML